MGDACTALGSFGFSPSPAIMTQFEGNPEFHKLLSGCGEVDLVQFMLEIAADAYPCLDRVGCLLEIDRLGVACADHASCRSPCNVTGKLRAISQVLYEVEGFHGNRDAYYEPENSYLNQVLERRRGIPISLGILYIAVAARTGLRMFGVNTPGHFIIGCCNGGEPLFVDPFSDGEVLDQCACRRRIEEAMGQPAALVDFELRAAANLDIAARVLRNLKAAYAMRECWSSVLRVQQRLAALLPQIPQERRDLGLVYLRLGEPTKALPVLEQYLHVCGSQQAEALAPSLQAARRMIAEMN
jgi:regulator of sirC expression with transglutaminase-like and TPR domain